MARVTKLCNSPECGGTMQPCRITFVPDDPTTPAIEAGLLATCKTCETDHPPDADFTVRDAKGWAAEVKANHGGVIPIPLPEH